MSVQRWLTSPALALCPGSGLPPGESFRLHAADEARRLGALPKPLIAAPAAAARCPPALAGQAVALPDDEHRKLRLAARRRVLVDGAKDLAQGAHLRPGEGIT